MSSETRQQGQPRYWCHICNAEVPIYMAPDPTCQQCNEQFIEELQSDDDPRAFLAGTDNNTHEHNDTHTAAHIFSYSPSTGRFNSLNGSNEEDVFQYFSPRAANNNNNSNGEENNSNNERTTDGSASPLGNFVQSLLTNMLGQNIEIPNTPEAGQDGSSRPMMFYGSMVDGNMRFQPVPGMPGSMGSENNENNERSATNEEGNNNTPGGERGPGTPGGGTGRANNMASILHFLSAMTGGSIDAGLVGNPNDYVFSQTALDNIITQLMEQTGGASAPPPAPEQVIEALKKRPLTDAEKSTETDCAVCKDQFESHEIVIELPCEHIFHDDCIKPWLKLNSTCPVCRHSVLPEQEENETNNNNTQNNTTTSQPENTSSTSFTWSSNGTAAQGSMPASWPSTMPASFPWTFNSAAARNNTSNNNSSSGTPQNQPSTPQQNQSGTPQPGTNNDARENTNNDPMDEDLDLD